MPKVALPPLRDGAISISDLRSWAIEFRTTAHGRGQWQIAEQFVEFLEDNREPEAPTVRRPVSPEAWRRRRRAELLRRQIEGGRLGAQRRRDRAG